eukprot:767916-Hanusia_phi.AAC.5
MPLSPVTPTGEDGTESSLGMQNSFGNDSIESQTNRTGSLASDFLGQAGSEQDWDYLEDDYYSNEEREELKETVLKEHAERLKEKEASEGVRQWHKSGAELGRGTFGVVYEAIDAETGEIFAVKEVDSISMRPKAVKSLEKEMDTLRQLKHVNIVRYRGMQFEKGRLSLFMELCTGGSISSVLDTFGPLTESIVRRDVKCANALLNSAGQLKLADFGGSKWLSECSTGSLHGTARYLAPEVLRGERIGRQVDIWAVGCCVVEMLTRQLPFVDQFSNDFTLMRGLSKLDLPPEPPENFPKDAALFVKECFVMNPKLRPSAYKLLKHVFFRHDDIESPYRNVDSPSMSGEAEAQNSSLDNDFGSFGESHRRSSLKMSAMNERYGSSRHRSALNSDSLPSSNCLADLLDLDDADPEQRQLKDWLKDNDSEALSFAVDDGDNVPSLGAVLGVVWSRTVRSRESVLVNTDMSDSKTSAIEWPTDKIFPTELEEQWQSFLKESFPARIKRTALFLDAVLAVSLLKSIFEIAVYKYPHDMVNNARVTGCVSWRLMARIPPHVCKKSYFGWRCFTYFAIGCVIYSTLKGDGAACTSCLPSRRSGGSNAPRLR